MLHLIRTINDPEHPLSLEELNVVEQVRVKVGTFFFFLNPFLKFILNSQFCHIRDPWL